MGLDQYFYKKKPVEAFEETEVGYFRKNWDFHDKVTDMLGTIKNGSCVKLDREMLNKLIFFLKNKNDYWAKTSDEDDDEIKQEGHVAYYSEQFVRVVGAFVLYDEIWYCPDW
jgi:hypothetical protein